MCGRFLRKRAERIAKRTSEVLHIDLREIQTSFNIAPSQTLEMVAAGESGKLVAREMRWGLIPSWAEGDKAKVAPINARSEEVFSKPMFRQAVQKRRCVIPADGFYEWKRYSEKLRQPYHIQLRDGEPFFFAGIYGASTETRPATFALLTTAPNAVMTGIHDRMPVILREDALRPWLTPGGLTGEQLAALCGPYAAEAMEAWPVSSIVNSPANNSPQCIERRDGIVATEPRNVFARKRTAAVDDGQGELLL